MLPAVDGPGHLLSGLAHHKCPRSINFTRELPTEERQALQVSLRDRYWGDARSGALSGSSDSITPPATDPRDA